MVSSHPQNPSKGQQPNTWLELAIRNRLDGFPVAENNAFCESSKTLAEESLLSHAKEYDDRHKGLSPIRPSADNISKFVRSIQDFMTGISTGRVTGLDISALVVGAVRTVIGFAIKFETFFVKLIDILCRLAGYIEPLAEFAESKNTVIVEHIAGAYSGLLTFCRDARRVFEKYESFGRSASIWTFIRTHWDPFVAEFRHMEARLKLHLEIVLHSATSSLLDESYRGNFEVELDYSQEDVRHKDEEQTKLLEWLSGPDFEKRHVDIYAKKHPGTTAWFLDTGEFKTWFNSSEEEMLWIHGKSGIGKSVLASNVIEHLSTIYALDDRVCILYVYYDYRDETLGDPSQVVSGLMKQACRQKEIFPGFLFRRKYDFPTSSTVCCTTESLLRIGERFEKFFLVIDGLDECPAEERDKALDFLGDIAGDLYAKVIATCRGDEDLRESFESMGKPNIEIQTDRVMGDVKKYVRDQVKQLREGYHGKTLYLGDNSLEDAVVRTLTDQSQGMLLWVIIQLEFLCRMSTGRDDQLVREALNNLPQGLDATYAFLLLHIEHHIPYAKELALKTFVWMFHSRRPLSIRALKHAIAENSSRERPEYLNLDETIIIMEACANLIHEEYDTIRPIHRSFQEFIMSSPIEKPTNGVLKTIRDVSYANEMIALTCLSCLTSIPRLSPYNGREWPDYLSAYPFVHYAAYYFDLHVKALEDISAAIDSELKTILDDRELTCQVLLLRRMRSIRNYPDPAASFRIKSRQSICMLISNTDLFDVPHFHELFLEQFTHDCGSQHVLRHAAGSGRLSLTTQLLRDGCFVADYNELGGGARALYFACEGGHLSTVSLLLEYNAEVNILGSSFETPLQAASYLGYDSIVEILLAHGADTNARARSHGNALEASSYWGHERIVQMLLDHGADVNAHNEFTVNGNALQAASLKGHKRVVQMLLEGGADVNAQLDEGRHRNALQAASFGCHYGIVRILLDHGADVNANDACAVTLQIASSAGCERIVRLLLDRGADINAQSRPHGNALQAASAKGSEKAVRLLLNHGANVNTRTEVGKYGNALEAASAKRHEKIVQLLFGHGADANALNIKSKYGTALQAASSKGSEKIVRMLLDRGSDPNVHCRESWYGNALQAASYKGHERVVEILLDYGADVNLQNPHRWYGSPIHAASRDGSEKVVRLLLNRGADANTPGYGLGMALQIAASENREGIVQLLLDHGADANASDVDAPYVLDHLGLGEGHRKPLQTACENGNEKMVKLLLDHGADVNSDDYRSALYLASDGGNLEIVKLLLDKGADANRHTGGYALSAASSQGHLEIVRLLLDRGADVDYDDGNTEPTALEAASKNGHVEVVKLLLEYGADVHHNNACALQQAGRYDKRKVVRILLDRGAQVLPFRQLRK